MSTATAPAPTPPICPPQGSGCAEGYTAACLSIHAQLHPRTTTLGLEPSQTGSATPITHTLCCPRTFDGSKEGIFTFTCGVHPEVHSWSVCHSVVQKTLTETWNLAETSNTASMLTTTLLPGYNIFQPAIAPIDCILSPATSTGSQTLPTLPTTPIQTSSAAATDGTPATTQETPTTTPVPAGAAGMGDGATRVKTAVGFVFLALLGAAAL
ncbi:hypothetical protein FGLOB1_13234 [Fusarium globosum]|uniref:Uncharacterized protein n=1 Tax=Fusarium globosum TaxID=78864 RepID=A0A8H6CYD2_9HYPO|nr:hypothetical protein FGLOB1_13234 [Fusarium globosum]